MEDVSTEHPGGVAAEQAAAMLTAAGMQRMPARVMMALVGSPDGGYTAAELCERLGISPAAVSGAVRYLTSMRIVHRLSRPGERVARYDVMEDGWRSMVIANVPMYTRLGDYVAAIADENTNAPVSAARAHDMAAFLRFLAKRMPEILREWEQVEGPRA